MKWRKIALSTTTDAVELVADMLNDLGFEGIEIVDNLPISESDKKAMFIDYLPELDKDDGLATLYFYMDMEDSVFEMEERVKEGLLSLSQFIDIGSGSIDVSETADADWINNWKEFFKPFHVDENIIIKPSWESLEDVKDDTIVIELDPGTAFGTGTHETTRLCIEGMKRYINHDTKLLDVGCGSGILSIIGLKLGASHAVGTDIDENAAAVSRENAQFNQIRSEQFTIHVGNLIDDEALKQAVGYEAYDVVTANILADVIIPLSSIISGHLKSGGYFISSGIIEGKKNEVLEAMQKNGFEIIEMNQMGDWVSIVGRKPQT